MNIFPELADKLGRGLSHLTSRDCYCLIYARRDVDPWMDIQEDPSEAVRAKVDESNSALEKEILDYDSQSARSLVHFLC